MKYVYPTIFKLLENEEYFIKVPDLPGCVTEGKNLADALEMAQDAISMWLCDAEDNNETIPPASDIFSLSCHKSEFVNLISADTTEYRNLNDSRAIKKTLTIPNWLNTKAEKVGINFSQVLQEAIKQKLNIYNRP
jgi:antitoxin HicB